MRDSVAAVSAATAVLLALSVASSSASVVYDGGAPDQGGQLYAQAPATEAMNFVLKAGVNSVNDAHWWGGCFSSNVPGSACGASPDFVLSFYADTGGSGPGALITSFDVGAANQTATGKNIGPTPSWPEYYYSSTFASVALTPGTTYWFGIQETSVEPTGLWGVETTSSAPAGQQTYSSGIFTPPPTWHSQSETLAFNLTQTVPEPSTWAMVLMGFAGLGYTTYRKRAALRSA